MELGISYLGLQLEHPLMPGASPLVDDLDQIRRLEDAGAAAIVMHSLFEEEIVREQFAAEHHMDSPAEAFPEALSYFPPSEVFALRPDHYLEHIRKIREAVDVPVIASLNGDSPGGWVDYAKQMQQAGAHALELNLYTVATDPSLDADALEQRELEVVRGVRAQVRIPVAAKLSPFYTSLPAFAKRLESIGVDGAVLFNRFYQPDIDPEALEMRSELQLSHPAELRLRLHGLATVSASTNLSLAATGGVHDSLGAVKALMAGAHGVQMVSALLHHGPEYLAEVRSGLAHWLVEHEYESVQQLIGSMNMARCPDPSAYERGNYARLLQSWHGR
jgi:dihydroorotate dehydrogenase (fumarate)